MNLNDLSPERISSLARCIKIVVPFFFEVVFARRYLLLFFFIGSLGYSFIQMSFMNEVLIPFKVDVPAGNDLRIIESKIEDYKRWITIKLYRHLNEMLPDDYNDSDARLQIRSNGGFLEIRFSSIIEFSQEKAIDLAQVISNYKGFPSEGIQLEIKEALFSKKEGITIQRFFTNVLYSNIIFLLLLMLRSLFRPPYALWIKQLAESGIPLWGVIPKIRNDIKNRNYWSDQQTKKIFLSYTSIIVPQFLKGQSECNKVLVTGSRRYAGKSTVAMLIGHAISLMNKKVLVVDLDLHKASSSAEITAKFCLKYGDDTSLNRIEDNWRKCKEIDIERYAYEVSDGLFYCFTGKLTREESLDMLTSGWFKGFISEASQCYDYILLDTPPYTLFPDSEIVASHADLCLLVSSLNIPIDREISYSKKFVKLFSQDSLGVILNKTPLYRRFNYGYVYGYYGYYDYEQTETEEISKS